MYESKTKIIVKIAVISFILIILLAIGVYAVGSGVTSYTIVHSDGHKSVVLSGNTRVDQILKDGSIIVNNDETTYPKSTYNIDLTKTITIKKVSDVEDNDNVEEVNLDDKQEVVDITKEQILDQYTTSKEIIITEQIEIPYETVTKDISTNGNDTEDKVLQEGENGLKELKYKVKYQNEVEIERVLISEEILKEPVEKIIQVANKVVSRASSARTGGGASLAQSVEGQTPREVTLNASAYSGDSSTASGARPQTNYTVAMGKSIPFGTVVYIPYFANTPSGGYFVCQDRGGAISDGKIDIYMGSSSACSSFGRRNLTVYIYDE